MKSFFQRIHDSHSATRRKDPKEASNAKTERSRRVTAGTAPAAHLEQIHTGSRTVDKRGTSQQPEPYHDYRAASSSRPYATLPLFGRNLPSNSRQTPSSTEPLPPQSSSHSILPSQREGHQLRARPSKDIVKAPDYRSVTRDADALKKSSHDRSRSDRLGSAPPPEVRTTQQAYPSKPSERDVYSNLAERNDKYGDKERQKEKMRQENGRGDRDVSERDRGKPMVEEGERPRAREREKDRHRHAHKNREREKEQEQEREARERGLLARARGRERGQESETQEREREREPDRERKSNKERDRDKDRERAMGRNRHDDRDRERQRDQPKAKHGTSDREYPGGQNITNPTYSRPRDQGWIRAKESYVGGERYQEPGKNILQSEHRTTRNPSSKDENKANEGDSSDSSRYRRTVAPSIHRNVPTETRAQMDRKPRHEELPVATSSFAPLSSIPHSNIASTTTENYVANFFASGAMHVHLPAKEPSFQSNQDKLPSQPLETFQEGLLSSNKKEGKRKVLNHLSNGLASSSKADPPLPSANSTSVVLEHKAKMRENERDNYHSDAKLKESTGMSSWRSFARQKEHFQIPSNAVSDVPLSTLAPSDTISPAQKLRAGQDPSNAYDTSKPTEITQPVTRPYTTRTDTHNPNHEIQYPSTHLTATHSTSDRPQLYSPPPLPEPPSAIVYAGTPGKHVSAVETSSLSKTIPKDVGSGSLRNATSVTNAQTTSVTTGYNASALLQSRNNHVPTYAQPDTSNLVETAQVVPRHNVTSAENHGYHNNATQNSMNVMPSLSNKFHPDFTTQSVPMPPSVVAYPSASSKHESTAELASFLKNIPRDDGSTPLRNTLLASNTQVAVAAMQKVLLPVQNQTNHANAQVKPTNSSNSAYEQSQGQTAKSNIDQNVISKGHQNLPNSLPTPTVVPNLVAEFEARSSAHNGVLRPHVNTGPSIPPASGSRQVSKDLPSQEFPTVVPAALPSSPSAKSFKISPPISGDERSSTAMNQKEKNNRDLRPTSASSQQLQGYTSNTAQQARVDQPTLHAPMPFDRDGMNYDGKYHQSYISNTPRVPLPEKQSEESTQYNPERSVQMFSRPEPAMAHGAKTASSSRVLSSVEVLPSTASHREVPFDQSHEVRPSRDEWSGGKVSEDISGTGLGVKNREIQRDTPPAVAHSALQAGVPRHAVIETKMSPTVQEHKPGHDSRGSSEAHLPSVVRASPRQSPKPNTNDSNSEAYPLNHLARRHRSVSSFAHSSSYPKEREQGKADIHLPMLHSAPVSHLPTSDMKEVGSGYSQDLSLAKPHQLPLTSPETHRPAIHHSKLAEILSSPSPSGRKDDKHLAPQKLIDTTFKTSRTRSESAKLPPQPSSHTLASNTASTPNPQDPVASRQSLELASTRQPANGSSQNSPARGQPTTNTPPSANPPRIPPATSHVPSPISTPLVHSTNTQNSHTYSHTLGMSAPSRPQTSSAVAGASSSQLFTGHSLTSSGPDAGSRYIGATIPPIHSAPQAQTTASMSGNHGLSQVFQKVYSASIAPPPITSSSSRGQAKPYNYPLLKGHRIDSSSTHVNPGPSNSTLEINKQDTDAYPSNTQSLSQATSYQPPSTRYQQQVSLTAATAPSFPVAPSTRTHAEPTPRPTALMRDSQSRKVEALAASTSARLPTTGSRPPEKVSRTPSEESSLKTPSSLTTSMLKQTPSRTSIPASVSSQQDSRKKGFFGMFKPKTTQPQPQPQPQPQKYEIWHPPSGTQKSDRKEPRRAESPPTMQRNTDAKIVSSRANASTAITVPITIAASGRRSPNSKVFTPFRYLTSKRNRNMSAASVEAQDGTAANTVVGSPTASVHSQPPIQIPPQRDPLLATQEWRKREAAEAQAKTRRQRPGVVFDVAEDPLEGQHRSRPIRTRQSAGQVRSN